jgi:hypothetical protein
MADKPNPEFNPNFSKWPAKKIPYPASRFGQYALHGSYLTEGKLSNTGDVVASAYTRPLDMQRVNIDALYELGAVVLEPVPLEQRQMYKYWRGASLAKLALNFARGVRTLNAGTDPVAHFTESYSYAVNTSKHSSRQTQWTAEDKIELSQVTGRDIEAPLPSIAFALDERYNGIHMRHATQGMGHGYVFEGHLPLSMIDPYSRELITELLIK